MAHSISKYNVINLGTSSGESPRKREVSVARLIEIVEELKHDITGLDLELLNQVIDNSTDFSAHLLNTSVHLDNATMKNLLVEMISAYQSGTLGGGGGGGLLVANRTILLATTTSTHGTIAVVQNEGTNMYIWNNTTSKWAVKEGNAYLESELPSNTDFEIIPGTELINSTTGERFVWSTLSSISPVILSIEASSITPPILTIAFSEPVLNSADYLDSNLILSGDVSGANIGLTYVSGSGTNTYVYNVNAALESYETLTLSYTGGIEDSNGNDLERVTNFAVINKVGAVPLAIVSALSWAFNDNTTNNVIVCAEDPTYNLRLLEGLGAGVNDLNTSVAYNSTLGGIDLTGTELLRRNVRTGTNQIRQDRRKKFATEFTFTVPNPIPATVTRLGNVYDLDVSILEWSVWELGEPETTFFSIGWNSGTEKFKCITPTGNLLSTNTYTIDNNVSHRMRALYTTTAIELYIYNSGWNLFHTFPCVLTGAVGNVSVEIGGTYINNFFSAIIQDFKYMVIE